LQGCEQLAQKTCSDPGFAFVLPANYCLLSIVATCPQVTFRTAPAGALAVADRGDGAVGVVVVAVVEKLGGVVGIAAVVRQAAQVLRQRVDDAVAVGELKKR